MASYNLKKNSYSNKFLTDLVNKESTYKETLHNKLKERQS